MNVANFLEFLNKTKSLQALDYATCSSEFVNFLDFVSCDEQFIQKIDVGVMYISEKTPDTYTIVDGLNRILSLSLLLHAICECYKKTTPKNEKAINIIRTKYILNGTKTKLRLPDTMQDVYERIVYGEKLSGKEKNTPMFKQLHKYWSQIKEGKLQASCIFRMLQKLQLIVVDVENTGLRELYYSLNNDTRELDQLLLIKDYMSELKLKESWNELCDAYNNKKSDIVLFFKDFFQNQFNFEEFNKNKLYYYYVNYYETVRKYVKVNDVFKRIKRYSELYLNLLNVNMPNEVLRQAVIDIKMLEGEDTFSYLLSVYSDYDDGSISESTFVEILGTVREYLQNRNKTPNNVSFNELIQYLNALLACK